MEKEQPRATGKMPKKSKEYISSSESETDGQPKPKKKKGAKMPKKTGAEGEQTFQLSEKRFVNVNKYHGKVLVGIREYYEVDGELKPGKKGISLSLEQWNSLKDQMEEIDSAIKEI